MRRAAVLAGAFAVLGLAVAASASAHSRNPVQRYTAADTKRAQALALKRSDLAAGWKADKPTQPTPCTAGPDESNLVQTARIDPSFTWKDHFTNVGSEVDIFRSAREAGKDWNFTTVGLMGTCLLQSARRGVGKHIRVTLDSSKRLAPPKDVERALHYRFTFTLHSTPAVPLVADVVALGRGRVTTVLHTLTVGRPLPAAAVNVLVGVLADRLGRTGITA